MALQTTCTQGDRLLRGAAIIVIFLAIVAENAWYHPWHQVLVGMHVLTNGRISHESLWAILHSAKEILTICLCTTTVMWLFGGGAAQAFKNLGLSRRIARGVLVGIIATLPLPIIYAIWWHATFNADAAVQVGVFGLISGAGEELLFRGFGFGMLYRKLRLGFWLSIILPTFAFARGHLYQVHGFRESLAIVALTGFGSVWFSWLYVRWDYNLWVPIAVHVLMNSWWSIFNVSQNDLAGHAANNARLLTVVLSVILTLWHCGWDWRKAFLHVRPEESDSTPVPALASEASSAFGGG
jgi:membrane protease YdiL (CAAX protease family)